MGEKRTEQDKGVAPDKMKSAIGRILHDIEEEPEKKLAGLTLEQMPSQIREMFEGVGQMMLWGGQKAEFNIPGAIWVRDHATRLYHELQKLSQKGYHGENLPTELFRKYEELYEFYRQKQRPVTSTVTAQEKISKNIKIATESGARIINDSEHENYTRMKIGYMPYREQIPQIIEALFTIKDRQARQHNTMDIRIARQREAKPCRHDDMFCIEVEMRLNTLNILILRQYPKDAETEQLLQVISNTFINIIDTFAQTINRPNHHDKSNRPHSDGCSVLSLRFNTTFAEQMMPAVKQATTDVLKSFSK